MVQYGGAGLTLIVRLVVLALRWNELDALYEGLSEEDRGILALSTPAEEGHGQDEHRHRQGGSPRWMSLQALLREVHEIAASEGMLELGPPLPEETLNKTSAYEPWNGKSCHRPVLAHEVPIGESCPSGCKFLSEDFNETCHFMCVDGLDCGNTLKGLRRHTVVAQAKGPLTVWGNFTDWASSLIFTRSVVQDRMCVPMKNPNRSCKTCDDEAPDAAACKKCLECEEFYTLIHGKCVGNFTLIMRVVTVLLTSLIFGIVGWYIHLRRREACNEDGLEHGLLYRARSRLLRPRQSQAAAGSFPRPENSSGCDSTTFELWPLSTNLLQEPAGGPGLLLFFHFQFAIIFWAAVFTGAWVLYGMLLHKEMPGMLWSGYQSGDTRFDHCSAVLVGKEEQRRTVHSKIAFLMTLYTGSCVAALVHARLQDQRFRKAKTGVVSEFAALCEGLPVMRGSEMVEDLVSSCFEAAGCSVVGVSMCWDYKAVQKDIMDAVDEDLSDLLAAFYGGEDAVQPEPKTAEGAVSPAAGARSTLRTSSCSVHSNALESRLSSLFSKDSKIYRGLDGYMRARNMLLELQTTGQAFVVFHTKESRDAAIARADSGGLKFDDGQPLRLRRVPGEPATVRWADFANTDQLLRILMSVIILTLVVLLWVVVFYRPYAIYVSAFSYEYGEVPTSIHKYILLGVVVGGNQLLFLVCDFLADWVGFRYRDYKEVTYVILYLCSCSCNLVLDVLISSLVAYKKLVAQHTRIYDRRLIADLKTYSEIFFAFPMQQALGYELATYAFPACYAIPYILEPIFTIFLPYNLACLLVRSNPKCTGIEAEKSLQFLVGMDLARYADVLLNVLLLMFVLFFPSGFTLPTAGMLVLCHAGIFMLDHYRVLRATPRCRFASQAVDRVANGAIGVLLGLILVCVVQKWTWANEVYDDRKIAKRMLGAFCIHIIFYAVALRLLRRCASTATPCSRVVTYKEVASKEPANYFTTNPVHCLRSRYIYAHSPHCVFYTPGKEHLQMANPSIGLFFEEGDHTAVATATEGFSFATPRAALSSRSPRGSPRGSSQGSSRGSPRSQSQEPISSKGPAQTRTVK